MKKEPQWAPRRGKATALMEPEREGDPGPYWTTRADDQSNSPAAWGHPGALSRDSLVCALHGPRGKLAGAGWRSSRVSVLTLHPVPTHWTDEVGVEAEWLLDLPEDLPDVPDLPRDGHQVHLHVPEEAGCSRPAEDRGGRQGGQRDHRGSQAEDGGRPRPCGHVRCPGQGHGGQTHCLCTTALPGSCQAPCPPLLAPSSLPVAFLGSLFRRRDSYEG